MRAFRPSHFALPEELSEVEEDMVVKEQNLQRYVKLVRAGLPLFESPQVVTSLGMITRGTGSQT